MIKVRGCRFVTVFVRFIYEVTPLILQKVTHGPVWDTGLMALGLLESGTQTEAMDRKYLF